MAKRLLSSKNTPYQEINVDLEPGMREEMVKKTKRRTVPQIFIDNKHIGGFDELYALDRNKHLDSLLRGGLVENHNSDCRARERI
jgi:glutaredoxin 3